MKLAAMILTALAMLADAITTHQALKLGFREGNSIVRKIFGAKPRLEVAIAWRALVFAVLAIWVPMPWWGWGIFGSLFVLAACRNAALREVG